MEQLIVLRRSCTSFLEEKEMEFEYAPNGIIGLETPVGLAFRELYHKKVLSLEQMIEKLAINPRKILESAYS